MQPRLARNGTLTSAVDAGPKLHSQVKSTWPNVTDPHGLSNNADDIIEISSAVMENPSGMHRGSLRSLRPTKFSPPPRPTTFISNNVVLTILFIFVVILVIALIVTFTVTWKRTNQTLGV
ncbi:hypothetical protein Btru_010675 [Bulinus truncatus]|nr:hypothetical protein Btru_010675 [Bulinus truncatus]